MPCLHADFSRLSDDVRIGANSLRCRWPKKSTQRSPHFLIAMSDDETVPTFKTSQEEIDYWKNKYNTKSTEYKELEESFEEFQDSSRELEKEMEKDLERSEKRLSEVTSQYHKLKAESDAAIVSIFLIIF